MRLVTFAPKQGAALHLGLVRNGEMVIDLAGAGSKPPFDPADMVSLIEGGAKALKWLDEVAAKSKKAVPLDAVRLAAPIPRPRKNVFCVGWNYVEHFEEGKKARAHTQELPAHPAFFSKVPTTVIGPYDSVPFDPEVNKTLDWEVELGVIIGRGGKNIPIEQAYDHVFGYTCINDVSARDLQSNHSQFFKGKSLDGACPMGPWIVTADEIPDPHQLHVTCRVNGVIKQAADTGIMIFHVPDILTILSRGMTLDAGDIIATGTPSGVGFARKPPEFLKPGDVVEVEIDRIGVLRNRVGD